MRNRVLGLLAALTVVTSVVIIADSPDPKQTDATCGYVIQLTNIGPVRVWTCWGAGGGGGGSW